MLTNPAALDRLVDFAPGRLAAHHPSSIPSPAQSCHIPISHRVRRKSPNRPMSFMCQRMSAITLITFEVWTINSVSTVVRLQETSTTHLHLHFQQHHPLQIVFETMMPLCSSPPAVYRVLPFFFLYCVVVSDAPP